MQIIKIWLNIANAWSCNPNTEQRTAGMDSRGLTDPSPLFLIWKITNFKCEAARHSFPLFSTRGKVWTTRDEWIPWNYPSPSHYQWTSMKIPEQNVTYWSFETSQLKPRSKNVYMEDVLILLSHHVKAVQECLCQDVLIVFDINLLFHIQG
jgi:hypothetical protein